MLSENKIRFIILGTYVFVSILLLVVISISYFYITLELLGIRSLIWYVFFYPFFIYAIVRDFLICHIFKYYVRKLCSKAKLIEIMNNSKIEKGTYDIEELYWTKKFNLPFITRKKDPEDKFMIAVNVYMYFCNLFLVSYLIVNFCF